MQPSSLKLNSMFKASKIDSIAQESTAKPAVIAVPRNQVEVCIDVKKPKGKDKVAAVKIAEAAGLIINVEDEDEGQEDQGPLKRE